MARHRAIPGTLLVGAGALAVSGLISCLGGTSVRRTEVTTAAADGMHAAAVRVHGAAVRPPDWERCTGLPEPPPDTGTPPAGLRCATLKVPLDYARPAGRRIDIALIKVPATDRRHRIGSLLLNFGGPGGDGVDTLAQVAGQYAELGTRYDLVAFDPRGVGRSTDRKSVV